MYAVARKSRTVAESSAGKISSPAVEQNTPEWRERVNNELEKRGRGAQADLHRHLKAKYPRLSTGHLAETLGPDEKPGQRRYTQYRRDIDEYLWPRLMPLTPDTNEIRYLLDGLEDADKDLLRLIKDMDRDAQRKLAEFLLLNRPSK